MEPRISKQHLKILIDNTHLKILKLFYLNKSKAIFKNFKSLIIINLSINYQKFLK